MDCSTPGLPVPHQLLESTQTHVHWISDAIQLSHPLSSPPPAFSLSQHRGLFHWVSSSHQVAKVLEFQLQHYSPEGLNGHEFGWTPGVGDGQGGLACCRSWGGKESDTTERLNWTESLAHLLSLAVGLLPNCWHITVSIFGSFLPYCPFSYCQMARASLFPSMVMFEPEFYLHLLRLWRWWRKILFSTPRLLPTSNQNLNKIGNANNLRIKINF